MLIVASFLGQSPHKAALSALGDGVSRLAPAMRVYPSQGPVVAFGTISPKSKETAAVLQREQLVELDGIASSVKKTGKPPALAKRWRAHKIDCFLYAQDDKYK